MTLMADWAERKAYRLSGRRNPRCQIVTAGGHWQDYPLDRLPPGAPRITLAEWREVYRRERKLAGWSESERRFAWGDR